MHSYIHYAKKSSILDINGTYIGKKWSIKLSWVNIIIIKPCIIYLKIIITNNLCHNGISTEKILS